jgi:hypothetical protein
MPGNSKPLDLCSGFRVEFKEYGATMWSQCRASSGRREHLGTDKIGF